MTTSPTIAHDHAVTITVIARCLPPPRRDPFIRIVKRGIDTRNPNTTIVYALDATLCEAA